MFRKRSQTIPSLKTANTLRETESTNPSVIAADELAAQDSFKNAFDELLKKERAIVDGNRGNELSYDFSKAIAEITGHHGKEYKDSYQEFLERHKKELTDSPQKMGPDLFFLCFAVYYALAYFYKRYDRMESLIKLSNDYAHFFCEKYPLAKEPFSWYYRRMGKDNLKSALDNDKAMIKQIAIEKNFCPYISYASTVALMLGKEADDPDCHMFRFATERQEAYKKALEYIEETINIYAQHGKHYAKHYAIRGELTMYDPSLAEKSESEIKQILDDAARWFKMALRYEDESSDDYFKRYDEYLQWQNRLELRRLQFITQRQLESLGKELAHRTARELEILTIFIAVTTFVIGGIEAACNMTASSAIVVVFALMLGAVFLLSALDFLLIRDFSYEKRKGRVSLTLAIISLVLFLVLIIFGNDTCRNLILTLFNNK